MTSEIKHRLTETYKYRIEMHTHSKPASPCGSASPEELAEIYSKKNYDAVVLSNHYAGTYSKFTSAKLENPPREEFADSYLEDFRSFEKACEKYGITAILGAEIRFDENLNDYLIYGVDRDILLDVYDYFPKGLEAYRREVSLDRSVFIQAHPFRDGMTLVDASLLDGIETFNMHPEQNSRVGLAVRYAGQQGVKIKTAGSDFHRKGRDFEGVAALRAKVLPKDSFELAEILKSGDYVLEIGDSSIVLP